MKILVIDDNATHRSAAQAQLKDHEVTVAESYDDGRKLIYHDRKHDWEEPRAKPFDAVLVDLLMPPGLERQGDNREKFIDQEMPVGIFLALLAAKNGAKFVAVFTDSDHHSHPASACFDAFNEGEGKPTPFTVCGAKMILSNNGLWVGFYHKDNLSEALDWEAKKGLDPLSIVRAKDWKALLEYVTSDHP